MLPVHPGIVLRRELTARALSANRLALALRVPSGRITSILSGKRGITAETALRLARYFGTGPELWLNLQVRYELAVAQHTVGDRVNQEVPSAAASWFRRCGSRDRGAESCGARESHPPRE